MYKILLVALIVFIPSICLADPIALVDGNKSDFAQTFTPDPTYSQVNTSMTGTVVFKKLPTAAETALGYIDFSNIIMMTVRPSLASTYYYNSDTTKTITLDAAKVTLIPLGKGVSKVTISFGAGTAEIQAMSK
jgi:hypothetical protein